MVSLAFTWGSIAFYRFLDSGVGSSRLSQHSFHNVAFTCALWRVHFFPLRSCKKLKWGPHPALGPYVVFVGFKEERRDKCGLFPTFLVSIACKLNRMSRTHNFQTVLVRTLPFVQPSDSHQMPWLWRVGCEKGYFCCSLQLPHEIWTIHQLQRRI